VYLSVDGHFSAKSVARKKKRRIPPETFVELGTGRAMCRVLKGQGIHRPSQDMVWLRFVGSLELYVFFAEYILFYKLFCKRDL